MGDVDAEGDVTEGGGGVEEGAVEGREGAAVVCGWVGVRYRSLVRRRGRKREGRTILHGVPQRGRVLGRHGHDALRAAVAEEVSLSGVVSFAVRRSGDRRRTSLTLFMKPSATPRSPTPQPLETSMGQGRSGA